MAHTPNECAHHLLDVFTEFDCRANDILPSNAFFRAFTEIGWETTELNVALKECIEHHWVSQRWLGDLQLTPSGAQEHH